jgi:SAM-dependent methyltransferase
MPTIMPFLRRRDEPKPTTDAGESVRVAYDTLAPAYDAFTAGYCHDRWLAEIERVVAHHGLRGRRVLDIACGTGKSFIPLLERGYAVTACDFSPEMARRAAQKAPGARVLIADMRTLPRLGSFDLVTCLDDALNHLLEAGELRATLAGIARQLAPSGLAVWDVNTLSVFRSSYSTDWVADRGEWFLAWHGMATDDLVAGGAVEASVDAFRRRGASWTRSTSRHRQRHWPVADVARIAEDSGLQVLAVLGQHRGARLEPSVDESSHIKALFVARARDRRRWEAMDLGGI